MLEMPSPSKLFVLSFTLGRGMFAHAGGEVVYGVPWGQKKACNLTLERPADDVSSSEAEVIFEQLLAAIRRSDTFQKEGDLRGVHTWHVKGSKTATVSIVRGQGQTFYLLVESPEFIKSFLVTTFERQQLLLAALALRTNGEEPTVVPGKARAWRDLDGIVL